MGGRRSSIAFRLVALVVFGFILSTWLVTAGSDQIETKLSAYLVATGIDGREELLAAEKVKPGEIIEYILVCTNKGPGQVSNLRLDLPIPEGTEYLPDTAKPKTVLASLDGKSFAPVPLKRLVKGADGTTREEIVPYREYRSLRWGLDKLGAKKNATVKARVKVMDGTPE